MSVEGLCEQFRWTADSEVRNSLTARYEPVQPFILLALVRRLSDVIFVDVGANIGFYTVVVGREPMVEQVHAFEPMPRAASEVRANVRANLADRQVTVHQVALSDQPGFLDFAVRGPLAGDNGVLADAIPGRTDYVVEAVPSERLDTVLAATDRHIVLKVDVEGHELSMLRGAERTLRENRGFLQIEMHESPANAEKLALLSGLGWHLVTRVGPDHYFSNIAEYYQDRSAAADVLEAALEICVEQSKSPLRESRRRIAPGVYVHVSRRKVNALKAALRRPA